MMAEIYGRCAAVFGGLIALIIFCIQSWATWPSFRKEEEAHHHNPFMNIMITLIVTLILLNLRLLFAIAKAMISIARGSSPLSLSVSAYLVLMIIWWILFSNDWKNRKEKEEFTDASWQFTYISSIVLPILTAGLLFATVKTGGKIC